MRNFNTKQNKIQRNARQPYRKTSTGSDFSAFVCDECCAPLHLYGANFIESCTSGQVNILRALCDLHSDEFELEVNV